MPYFVGLFYRAELFSKRELAPSQGCNTGSNAVGSANNQVGHMHCLVAPSTRILRQSIPKRLHVATPSIKARLARCVR
jgi:hypothetical protein